MLALLPLALSLAPEIAKWIGGDRAGAVATQAAGLVQAVTGTDDPAAAAAALTDPTKAADLRLRLAEIGAQRQAAADQAQLDALRATLADVQSARQQTTALAGQGSVLSWGAAVVTLILLGLFAAIVLGRLYVDVDIRETVKTLTIAAATYWIGSSRGSAVKDERGPAQPQASPIATSGDVVVNEAPRQPMGERSAEEMNRSMGGRQ